MNYLILILLNVPERIIDYLFRLKTASRYLSEKMEAEINKLITNNSKNYNFRTS